MELTIKGEPKEIAALVVGVTRAAGLLSVKCSFFGTTERRCCPSFGRESRQQFSNSRIVYWTEI